MGQEYSWRIEEIEEEVPLVVLIILPQSRAVRRFKPLHRACLALGLASASTY